MVNIILYLFYNKRGSSLFINYPKYSRTSIGLNTLGPTKYPKVLKYWTPNAINFPFVSNEKFMFFRCPSIQAHCNVAVIYLNLGHLKILNFPLEQMENLLFLGVPIL